MVKYISDPGGCVGCPPEKGCLGVEHCPQCVEKHFFCDICGEETDGEDICVECAQEMENFYGELCKRKGK